MINGVLIKKEVLKSPKKIYLLNGLSLNNCTIPEFEFSILIFRKNCVIFIYLFNLPKSPQTQAKNCQQLLYILKI